GQARTTGLRSARTTSGRPTSWTGNSHPTLLVTALAGSGPLSGLPWVDYFADRSYTNAIYAGWSGEINEDFERVIKRLARAAAAAGDHGLKISPLVNNDRKGGRRGVPDYATTVPPGSQSSRNCPRQRTAQTQPPALCQGHP
ncbi:hypothetical protein THAOC_27949, partial [Thalassiosira oceanica]